MAKKNPKNLTKQFVGKPLPQVEAMPTDATSVQQVPVQKKTVGNYKKIDSKKADLVRSMIPLPDNMAQLAAKLTGDARMSNSSLDDEQKVILWDVMQNAKKRTGKADGGTEYQDYGGIGYGSSDDFNNWWNKGAVTLGNVFNSFTNPGYELSSTIGRGRYWSDPENPDKMYYTDVYDWNKGEKNFGGSTIYQKVRNTLREGEEANLNKQKNENYRMNFELDRKEIEAIRKKLKNEKELPLDAYLDRNGGWLEKYNDGGPIQENYNDASVSYPPNFVGEGTINGPNWKSPAWGGQFQNGGTVNLPTIKDEGSFNKDGAWVPNWKAMAAQAKKLGAKKVKTDQGSVIYFNDKWEPVSADDSNVMAMGGSMPGAVGFTYARAINPAPSNGPYAKKTKASAQNGTEMKFYQEGLDWTPKTISKNGSVIKDDMGQWNHPGEITEIGSNQITMQGVPYPVLGISDTGDTQMMYPNQEYQYDGSSVTEYPMAQNGMNILNAAKAVGQFMLNQPDSNAENVAEIFDPTGISSWDDVYRSINNPKDNLFDTGLEIAGAVPLGKLSKITKPGIHLTKYKGIDKALYKNLPRTKVANNAVKGVQTVGRTSDAYQAYDQYEQGGQLTKLDQLTNFTNYNTKQPGGWLDKYQD